jgi:hypothetical protein
MNARASGEGRANLAVRLQHINVLHYSLDLPQQLVSQVIPVIHLSTERVLCKTLCKTPSPRDYDGCGPFQPTLPSLSGEFSRRRMGIYMKIDSPYWTRH